MSLITVVKPHRKNNVVMIANGPRYVWPLLDEEVDVAVDVIEAIIFWNYFELEIRISV